MNKRNSTQSKVLKSICHIITCSVVILVSNLNCLHQFVLHLYLLHLNNHSNKMEDNVSIWSPLYPDKMKLQHRPLPSVAVVIIRKVCHQRNLPKKQKTMAFVSNLKLNLISTFHYSFRLIIIGWPIQKCIQQCNHQILLCPQSQIMRW